MAGRWGNGLSTDINSRREGRMDEGQGRRMDAADPTPHSVLLCLPDVSNAIQRQPPPIPRLISDPPLYSPLTHQRPI